MSTTNQQDSNDKNPQKNEEDDLVHQLQEKLDIKEDDDNSKKAAVEKKKKKKKAPDIPDCIHKAARWIEGAKNIMVLTGAGVSVSAGIPDFRTPGTGLYDNLQQYNLPYPEAVFVLDFFRHNPQPFLRLAREIWPGQIHSPTLTHSFLSLLHHHQQQEQQEQDNDDKKKEKKNRLLRVYTQNIDGLEYLAGIPADRIVECHGHFRTVSCIDCHKPMKDPEKYVKAVLEGEGDPPSCGYCGGMAKPDIVFFGESLPNRFHRLLNPDILKADLLLVLGTSLQVAPVSMIPDQVDCKRVLINRERVGSFYRDTKNDVFLQGDCDDTIRLLAQALGWEEDLEKMHQSSKIKQEEGQEER